MTGRRRRVAQVELVELGDALVYPVQAVALISQLPEDQSVIRMIRSGAIVPVDHLGMLSVKASADAKDAVLSQGGGISHCRSCHRDISPR